VAVVTARTLSRRPEDREAVSAALGGLLDLLDSLPPNPAASAMDYEQAQALHEAALQVAAYAHRVSVIRTKQSGKSAARASRGLGPGAL
jgi:hypothetical protein